MKILRIFFTLIAAFIIGCMHAQQPQEWTTVTGRVTDSETRKPIVAASVTDAGGNHATVTNEDGTFILRMPQTEKSVRISHIGYATRVVEADKGRLNVRLRHTTIMLNDILAARPEDVIAIAIRNIGSNYVAQPVMQRCFYRETTRKGSRYIYVAEAINDMYRTPYSSGIDGDRVAIIKARRLISTNARDTLGAKLMGGPTTPLTLDIVKNLDFLLNPENLAFYNFDMSPALSDDGQALVKVTIVPKPGSSMACPYALLYGDIYVTTNTLAITHADLQLDLSNKAKATQAMLYRKPAGVRFKPRGMELYLTYKLDLTGRLSLNYIRSEVSFVCEWKRKFFAAPYHVTSEMVVTGESTDNVRPIKSRDSFKQRESLYDHPEFFGDPDFWQQYNIIAPSESLEKGIGRLMKKEQKAK